MYKMPNIGYGSSSVTRHMMPTGFKKVLIHNVKELEVLMMSNKTYCAEIARGVSAKNRFFEQCQIIFLIFISQENFGRESSPARHQNHQPQCQDPIRGERVKSFVLVLL